MGLDITAYRNLQPRPDAEVDDEGYPINENHWHCQDVASTETLWPGRTEGLADGMIYECDHDEVMDFGAGSYGSYNDWRATLAQLAGLPPLREVWDSPIPISGPFVELVNFSDCEGVIGPVVAAKLAQDFAEHEAMILAKAPDDYFRGKYKDWRIAFEMAAQNGAVEFH